MLALSEFPRLKPVFDNRNELKLQRNIKPGKIFQFVEVEVKLEIEIET